MNYSVDCHVGQYLFERILSSESGLLRGKTRILVTNNLSVLPFTDSIIVLKEGQIAEYGTYSELLEAKKHFANLITQYFSTESQEKGVDNLKEKIIKNNKNPVQQNKSSKLIEKEESQIGRVQWSVYSHYLKVILNQNKKILNSQKILVFYPFPVRCSGSQLPASSNLQGRK